MSTTQVQTARFGPLVIDDNKILYFDRGLYGLAGLTRWTVLSCVEDSALYWLQSVDDPQMALVVAEPLLFVPDYGVTIKEENLDHLQIVSHDDLLILAICCKHGDYITANLLSPLAINGRNNKGVQVLTAHQWSTTHPIRKIKT